MRGSMCFSSAALSSGQSAVVSAIRLSSEYWAKSNVCTPLCSVVIFPSAASSSTICELRYPIGDSIPTLHALLYV